MHVPSQPSRPASRRVLSRRRVLLSGSAFALGSVATGVFAQSSPGWPTKPVRIVTGWSPGGNADILARMLADHIGKNSAFPVIVENRPGAAGALGAQSVVRAEPDGHTLLVASMAEIMLVPPVSVHTLQYNPEKDLQPVTLIGRWPLVLAVNPSMPVNTLQELVAYCKANPRKVNFGSTGNGTINHLTGELLNQVAGIETVHVPYKGGAPMMNDLAGGQIQFGFDSLGSMLPLIRAGKVRPVSVTGAQRLTTISNVQTAAEAGYPDLSSEVWIGLFLPARTPREIADRVNAQAVAALHTPEMRKAMQEREMQAVGNKADEFRAGLQLETGKKRQLALRAGIKGD